MTSAKSAATIDPRAPGACVQAAAAAIAAGDISLAVEQVRRAIDFGCSIGASRFDATRTALAETEVRLRLRLDDKDERTDALIYSAVDFLRREFPVLN